MTLTPEEASPIAGVPVAQLKRWSWDRVGPRNSGTRYKPLYEREDILEWLDMRAKVQAEFVELSG